MWQREFQVISNILHWVVTLQIFVSNNGCSDDSNGTRSGAVTTGHFIVQLAHSPCELNITEFAVHVVSSRTGIVTQPDSVVFDSVGVLFDQFNAVQNFTCGLLHLTELVHVVPELGFSNNTIWCEDDHAISLRVGVFLGGHVAADHLELLHQTSDSHAEKEKIQQSVESFQAKEPKCYETPTTEYVFYQKVKIWLCAMVIETLTWMLIVFTTLPTVQRKKVLVAARKTGNYLGWSLLRGAFRLLPVLSVTRNRR